MIRTKSQLLLAKKEATQNEDPMPDVTNAIKTGNFLPGYRLDKLQRLIVDKGIDAAKSLIGKEYLDFSFPVELMGSGQVGVEPEYGLLLEACGLKKTTVADTAIDNPVPAYGNKGLTGLVVTSAGAFTGTVPRVYKIKVTTAGASDVAKVSVACLGDDTQNSTENTVTTETPINLGDEGITATFAFAAGELSVDDSWYVFAFPAGIRYRPYAYNEIVPSVFFYHYLGGLLFKGGGALGNFNLTAPSGDFAKLQFDFNSVFRGVSDAAIPDAEFTDRLPPIVESSNFFFDDENSMVMDTCQIETGNSISLRKDFNAPQGMRGFRITERDNSFKIDPEAELEADFAFWQRLRSRKEMPFFFQIGDTPGNRIFIISRRSVIDQPGMNEVENLLRYGITGQCRPTPNGNDNFEFFFY